MTLALYAPFALGLVAAAYSLAPDIRRLSRIRIFESLRRGWVVEVARHG